MRRRWQNEPASSGTAAVHGRRRSLLMNVRNELTEPADIQRVQAHATAKPNLSPIRVWLVDDNRRLRELLADLLVAEGGLDCSRQFGSAEAALHALSKENAPDAILLDNQMDGMRGIDALRPIRNAAGDTRVLMYTSCRDPETRSLAYRNGAADFLTKDCSPTEIAERIRKARSVPLSPLAAEETKSTEMESCQAASSDHPRRRSSLQSRLALWWKRSLPAWKRA
jgi:DNA-binding NarL/FixJ family response regulator